ncbi:phage tail fiber protein [Pseudomonas syringae]|uniref:phage tail fiber protein n=1 Tax=Pseudomonas syringae TaxID=317 RepID=UPI000465064B
MSMSSAALLDSLSYYFTSATVGSRPAAWAVSLHTAAPGDAGTGSEVTDSAYARQSATFALNTADASAALVFNTANIAFAAASTGYTATHAVVWDVTNSRPLVVQRLVTDKVIAAGEQAQFSPGELKIGGRN